MAVMQGPEGISSVYIKNGGVQKYNPNLLKEHDIAFWLMPNFLEILNQPKKEEFANVMGWAYVACGVDERIRNDRVFSSKQKQSSSRPDNNKPDTLKKKAQGKR